MCYRIETLHQRPCVPSPAGAFPPVLAYHVAMSEPAPSCSLGGGRPRPAEIAALLAILAFGAYLRFEGLGLRSLWRDELCTWEVAQMPLAESFKWGPELTKPPLYQLSLRLLTSGPHPSEAMLRLPAAVFGVLTIVAAWWLGRNAGGVWLGVAAGGLVAVNALQIFYSREARPYSMLAFGATMMVLLWRRVVIGRRAQCFIAFTTASVLTLYAHYLAGSILIAGVAWWLVVRRKQVTSFRPLMPLAALALVGVLCVPLVVRYLAYQSSMFQGLEWIEPVTWARAMGVLSELTFGPQWLGVVMLPTVALWIAGAFGLSPKRLWNPGGAIYSGPDDVCGLLLLSVLVGWGGLVVVSWIAHPAVVARYALPAAVPAILFPLTIAYRLDRRAPMVVMFVFALASAPQWLDRTVEPGFRELTAYLQRQADPNTEAVVLTIDSTVYPGWEESERLGFAYYPLRDVPVRELRLGADNVTAVSDALEDPRGLYLIVLWADEDAIVSAAGRKPVPIVIGGVSFSRLLFEPYRLMRIAPEP